MDQQPKPKLATIGLPLLVLALIVTVVWLIVVNFQSPDSSNISDNRQGQSAHNIVITGMVDYECQVCADWHPTVRQIIKEYQDRIIFRIRHNPSAVHTRAQIAHQAAQAAAKQNRFWEMHDLLLSEQDKWTLRFQPDLEDPEVPIRALAVRLNLDMDQFDIDFKSAQTKAIIKADLNWGKDYSQDNKIVPAPSFFKEINGGRPEMIAKGPDGLTENLDSFRVYLDKLLEEAGSSPTSQTPVAAGQPEPVNPLLTANRIGPDRSQIIVTKILDFACSHCAIFDAMLRPVKASYQDRIIFQVRHYPLTNLHPTAMIGHQAAEAAAGQGQFWAMHNHLFDNQADWTGLSPEATEAKMIEFAQVLALDVDRFRQDLNSPATINRIQADRTWLDNNYQIIGTPAFLINQELIPHQSTPRTKAGWQSLLEQRLRTIDQPDSSRSAR